MMNDTLKMELRKRLLACYDLDIDEAKCYYSTQNYAFIFPGKPYMLRISMTAQKTRREILSELMWVDDLKQFKQTICEPNVSKNGKLLEEFEIGGKVYRASMFRTARGAVEPVARMSPMFFVCVGDLLGTIHHVSTNERKRKLAFKRKTLAEQFAERKERAFPNLTAQVREKIEAIEAQVNALPQDEGVYGLCHGDFHLNNFFVEANNVWLFDFDGCCYANYLYDVVSLIQGAFLLGYKAGEDCRKVLYEDMLPYFKFGYELNKETGEHYWDHLELMLAYRTAYTLMALAEIKDCGVLEIEGAKKFFNFIITQDDILGAMTMAMKQR